MNKKRIILNYIYSFMAVVLLVSIILSLIVKITIFSKNNILRTMEASNYYSLVYDEINEREESYLISSGFSNDILDGVYSKDVVKSDINNYIDSVYNNKLVEFNDKYIRGKLTENINNFLKSNNYSNVDKKSINELIDDVCDIYINEIELYKTFNNYINIFNKLKTIIDIFLIFSTIFLTFLIFVLKLKNCNYLSSIFMACGIVLLFIKCVIYNKIEFKNIVIITDNFSIILQRLLSKIDILILCSAIALFVIFIINLIIEIIKRNKRE